MIKMQELSQRSENRRNSSFISIMNNSMVEDFMELSRSELISIFGSILVL
jgi:hypothetical protein